MNTRKPVLLVVGPSETIGVPVVVEAFKMGYETRVLVRGTAQSKLFPEGVHVAVGDLARAETLHDAVEGVVARAQIAQVLVASLSSAAANRKTFESVAERGAAQSDLEPLFSALLADPVDGYDGDQDRDSLPLANEPSAVVRDLDAIRGRFNARKA